MSISNLQTILNLQIQKIKNQINSFLLQTAILIFASETAGQTDEVILFKISNENIIQLVKTVHKNRLEIRRDRCLIDRLRS